MLKYDIASVYLRRLTRKMDNDDIFSSNFWRYKSDNATFSSVKNAFLFYFRDKYYVENNNIL